MGRLEPSWGRPPPGFRRDARAKKAKATANKTIPALLSSYPRARKGVDSAELISEIPAKSNSNPPKGATSSPGDEGMRIAICLGDTLATAHSLLTSDNAAKSGKPDLSNREARVGILNMASPLSAGGGFLNGATSQEESLCMRTTLLPSLRDEFYRLPEVGAVFTPDLLVFRDEDANDLEKRDRWFVDCVSAAMLRIPELTEEGEEEETREKKRDREEVEEGEGEELTTNRRYANAKDRELVLEKMRTVLAVFQQKGVRKVVLGAWGCGAYGNPVDEVAAAWKKALVGSKKDNFKGKKKNKQKKEQGAKAKPPQQSNNQSDNEENRNLVTSNNNKWPGIEEIVFAVQTESIADRFQRAFGSDLTQHILPPSRRDVEAAAGLDNGDNDPEEARVKELEDKISQLELQIQQVRAPHMKTGLAAALAGLRAQLPASRGGEDEEGEQDSQSDVASYNDDGGSETNSEEEKAGEGELED